MMPRFLYQLADRITQPPDQALKQKGFLNLLRDQGVSTIQPMRCQSIKELVAAIGRDFSDLKSKAPADRPDMGEALRLWTAFATTKGARAGDIWASRMASLMDAQKISLSRARSTGLLHLLESISEFDVHDRLYLKGFDEYLGAWSGVSAWAGLGGIFGQANMAKARIGLAQLLGRYDRISDLAGGVASGLYADRKIAAADRWYQVYRRNGEVRKIQGAIALARGNLALAAACFEGVLGESDIDDANASLHLGYYSLTLAREGHGKRAIKQADAALALTNVPPTVLTRVWRTRAEMLATLGDYQGAAEAVDEAEIVAEAAELVGQIRKARVSRNRIKSLMGKSASTPL